MQNYRLALLTNGFALGNEEHLVNIDMATGGFRPVDLTKPPFNISGTHIFSFEASKTETKKIFLWRRGA